MKIKYRLFNLFLKASTVHECHAILMKYHVYYQNLSPKNKKVFRIRTLLFVKNTSFQTDLKLQLTNEMMILISSAFVQLTFGLNQDILQIFNTILLTPKPYSYGHTKHLFKGDVNPRTKRISLVWPIVEKGFKVSDDGINLAIHEFGHCLILENSKRSYFSKFFSQSELRDWKLLGIKKMKEIKSKKNPVLRAYAGTNLMELFAVAIEEFFERPENFCSKDARFYFSFCRLLNQDPRRKQHPILSKKDYVNYPI